MADFNDIFEIAARQDSERERREPHQISPVGTSRSADPLTEARRQDAERQAREDDEYFAQTGINRRPSVSDEFLVPCSGSRLPDVANDGDSYDDSYIENASADRRVALEAYRRRQAVLDKEHAEEEEKRLQDALERCRIKFNNPISGLDL